MIAFGPEHAATVAARFSKAHAKRFLWDHAWLPLGRFSEENIERRLRLKFPERLGDAALDAPVPIVQRSEDFVFIVVGGAGKHTAFIPNSGATRSVTLPLKRRDGAYARSVEELRPADMEAYVKIKSVVAVSALVLVPGIASAQAFPARSVRFSLPVAAGGNLDKVTLRLPRSSPTSWGDR